MQGKELKVAEINELLSASTQEELNAILEFCISLDISTALAA